MSETEKAPNTVEPKAGKTPKFVMHSTRSVPRSGQGWYVKAWVKISELNDEIQLPPRFYKIFQQNKPTKRKTGGESPPLFCVVVERHTYPPVSPRGTQEQTATKDVVSII